MLVKIDKRSLGMNLSIDKAIAKIINIIVYMMVNIVVIDIIFVSIFYIKEKL